MGSSQRRHLTTIVVFGVASLAILAYLAFRPSDHISYELPELSPFAASEVAAITIERSDGTVTLRREGDAWLVAPGDYPADPATVGALLNALSGLNVTDVVSLADDPARYQLDEEQRVRVTATGSGGTLRVLDIGRHAATFDHTFVGLPGDGRILQASGQLRSLFDRDLDSFRNHSVLTFDPASVREISLTLDLPPRMLQTVRVGRSVAGPGWERLAEGGSVPVSEAEAQRIEAALRFLGDLSTHRYRYLNEPLGEPWLSVTLEGERSFTLRLYPQEGNAYPASSSESAADFYLFLFQAALIAEPFGLEVAGP